jgi:pSer/pThr/pTyr-binding forkhead associated (FHA) protein
VPAVLFVLHTVVLVLLWAFVVAAVVAVRHDVFGARRPEPATPTAAPNRPPRRTRPAREPRNARGAPRELAVVEGTLAGTTLPLEDSPITIGRGDDATLVISDDYVSTRHARLSPRDGAWVIEDLGSTNGTFLDRHRVTSVEPVAVGVPIRIGRTVLELRR